MGDRVREKDLVRRQIDRQGQRTDFDFMKNGDTYRRYISLRCMSPNIGDTHKECMSPGYCPKAP